MLDTIDIRNEFEGDKGAQIIHLLSPIFNMASMDENPQDVMGRVF